jgi:hypothetical protein
VSIVVGIIPRLPRQLPFDGTYQSDALAMHSNQLRCISSLFPIELT